MTYTLGVDIGTYSSKGMIVDETGAIVAEAQRPHEMIVPRPGWAEHRPEEDWWDDFVHITRALLDQSNISPGDIAGLAVSAIGPCMLPVDAAGAPLMNGVLYGVDTRAAEEIDILDARIGSETILDRCGNALTSQSVGPKILWLKRNREEIFEKTAKILTSTSFIVHRLTGEFVIDHYTAANFSPLYDVARCKWTDELADDIVSLDALPKLSWSTEIAGWITADAAKATGLAEGTPVTTGTIDAAAEAVSVGTRAAGDMMLMMGSTIFIIQVTADRVRDPRLWYAPWLTPGSHASMAGAATSGTLTHWFRDRFAQELPADTAFATLAAEAEATSPGADGLLFLPYFSGERTPIHNPLAKGALFGMNLTHGRGEVYRAVLEGVAMGTAHIVDTFRDVGAAPRRVLAVGGGTQNEVWLQATSDITGLTQIVSKKSIGASYGDAFLAAQAVGLAEAEDIAVWNPASREVVPARHEAYERQYPLFLKLYEQTKDIAGELG